MDKYKNQTDAEFSRSLQLLAQVAFRLNILMMLRKMIHVKEFKLGFSGGKSSIFKMRFSAVFVLVLVCVLVVDAHFHQVRFLVLLVLVLIPLCVSLLCLICANFLSLMFAQCTCAEKARKAASSSA